MEKQTNSTEKMPNQNDAESEVQCNAMNLLSTIFSLRLSADEKKKILSEKYNIAMTAELETNLLELCNLGTAIERRGVEKGIDIGKLELTAMLCERERITAEQAAKDLKMTVEEFTQKMNQLPESC